MAASKTNDSLIVTAHPRRYRSSVRGEVPEGKVRTPPPAVRRERGPKKKSDATGS